MTDTNKTKTEKPVKSVLMAEFREHYEKIQIAKAALADLENAAAEAAAPIVKFYDKGPHRLTTSDGKSLIVQFQKVQHKIRFTALDESEIE